ncbi:MAG: 2-hydroxyacid dehydrogenase [Burkholderiales bacterium]
MTGERIDVAVVLDMPREMIEHLSERYTVHYWPDPTEHARLFASPVGQRIRAVQTNGSFGLKRHDIDALPALEIIAIVGAGFEGVDLAAARERGIVVTYGVGLNASAVAEQAWSLLLAVVHEVPLRDRGVREGRWKQLKAPLPNITGRKLGIYGLGNIGKAMARRGVGFEMEVGYFSRTRQPDVPYRCFDSLVDLASWCDVLMVAAHGGPATYHAVNAEVLAALGPAGYVVNIARGTIIDTAALIDALREGRIAGAGLDVVEGEPAIPPALVDEPRVVWSPHIGGHSPDAITAMVRKVRANLDAHFAGQPVLSPVPG